MSLFNQYFLATLQGQKAAIRFHDGTVLHINERTDAVLQSPHVVRVAHGEVAEYLAPGTDHRIQTNSAIAGAIGTTYDVQTNGFVSRFVVLHGALQVRNAKGAVVVKSNHQTVVRPNQPPTPPSPVGALAVFAWTNGIPTPDLGEDIALDANGGSVAGVSSQRNAAGGGGSVTHINDGLLTEGWETASGHVSNQSVKIGFLGGNFYRISGVIIDPAATYGSPASEDLKHFEIRVSSTGTDEASFATVFQGTCKQENSLQHFTLPVPVRAKYVELMAVDNYGSAKRIAVAEWEVVATASLLAQPTGIAVDGTGNVYVADTDGNRIQKLSPKGRVLDRWGTKGDKPGQFKRPQGVALDKQGNIYVADTFNQRIQKLSPTGKALAQWGTSGLKPGEFLFPTGIALDTAGNVYVSDVAHRVQKLSPTGRPLATFSDLGNAGTFNFPEGLTVDRRGNIFVADSGDHRIVKLSPSGKVLRTFGSQGARPGELNQPVDVGLDAAGNLYVADSFNERIQKLSPSGRPLIEWGREGFGRAEFQLPYGVAVQGSTVYVTDEHNSRIQRFTTGGSLQGIWGKYTAIPQVLGEPAGVATDSHGYVYVTDDVNDRIQVRDPKGHIRAVYGYHGYAAREHRQALGQFYYPHGIAIDRRGAIYVADTFNNRIQILANRGPIGAIGRLGTAPGTLHWPEGVAVDASGNIYVADSQNDRIEKLSARGKLIWAVGSRGTGTGQFEFPTGVAVDRDGNVYASDVFGNRVQKLSSEGRPLAVWGRSGINPAGRFFAPLGLSVDARSNVYVADEAHGVIQKLAPDGKLLDVFELPGPDASPVAVSVDPHGYVYAVDSLSSRIVKFAPTGEVIGIWS